MKAHISSVLKKSGLKSTKGRQAILQYLSQEKKPVTVELIENHLISSHQEIDNATIYRILEIFVEHGIATRVEFKEGKFRYELSALPHHHHAICTMCGNIQDIEDCDIKSLETSVADTLEFTISSHTMDFFGLCKKCVTL